MKASRSSSPPYFGTGVTAATVLIKVLGIDKDGSRLITRCMVLVMPHLILKWNFPYQSIPVRVLVGGRLGSQGAWCAEESCCQSKPEDVSHGLASVLGQLANYALGVLVGLLDEATVGCHLQSLWHLICCWQVVPHHHRTICLDVVDLRVLHFHLHLHLCHLCVLCCHC
jgi:hypothetical protein